jgi:hypothetical protein
MGMGRADLGELCGEGGMGILILGKGCGGGFDFGSQREGARLEGITLHL